MKTITTQHRFVRTVAVWAALATAQLCDVEIAVGKLDDLVTDL